LPEEWQLSQDSPACPFVNANPLWLKLAGFQALVLWHEPQFVPYCPL
jgi:hypothetical protein